MSRVRARPGVYRVAGEPRWPTTVAGTRWRTARVEPVADLGAAYDELGRALDLPAWFGRNLDALWDCLSDLSVPTALLWRRWDGLEAAQPVEAARLLGVLRDRTTEVPDFAVVLGASIPPRSRGNASAQPVGSRTGRSTVQAFPRERFRAQSGELDVVLAPSAAASSRVASSG